MPRHSHGLSKEVLEAVTEAGVMAPSGDNLQPWRFLWDGNCLRVLIDRSRDSSLYNVRDLASFIAIGAAIENIVIAASSRGYSMEIVVFPDGDAADTVASISFRDGAEPDPLASVISERCANRRPYDGRRLAPHIIDSLEREVTQFERIRIHWIDGATRLKRLAKAVMIGDRLLFENSLLHSHFFSCLRWTSQEAERTRDGLPVVTLELGRLAAAALTTLASWRLVRFLNCLGLSRIVSRQGEKLIRSSSVAALLSVDEVSPPTMLEAGRAFQRLWLRATVLKLSLQPMTGFIFLQLRCVLGELSGLTEGQVKLLSAARDRLFDTVSSLQNSVPVMLVRLGWACPPSGRTLRRPLAACFTPASQSKVNTAR